MGQFNGKEEIRVPYDPEQQNGFIINENYIPEELFTKICHYIDHKELLNCHLVCKNWQLLIQNYIWRKKAEKSMGQILPVDNDMPWTSYYMICAKKPFNKNLIKNHSGELRLKHWISELPNWQVESPPVGVPPLPNDPVFEGKNSCFVTTYVDCRKFQFIDLEKAGLSEYILDNVRPVIKVSEWYSARWDCGSVYDCVIDLLTYQDSNPKNRDFHNLFVIDSFRFHKEMKDEDQNQWFHVEHEFRNYEKGVRLIRFCHRGKDTKFWAGHYGSKMAGACVKLEWN